MFGCSNICVCGQLPRYLWGWAHRPFSGKIPWPFSIPPPFFLNSVCKRRPWAAVDGLIHGVLTLMKSIWVGRVIYMNTSQCIIRINIIISLLPFLGFPLIHQFSSIRLGWVLAAHRLECSALWEQRAVVSSDNASIVFWFMESSGFASITCTCWCFAKQGLVRLFWPESYLHTALVSQSL